MNIDFPLHFDAGGRTARTGDDDHVRDLIEQLLLTSSGERVNRPDFGSGLLDLVFEPAAPELAAAIRFGMEATLQQWLGDLVDVRGLEVESGEGTLRVAVQYTVRSTGTTRVDVVERPGAQ